MIAILLSYLLILTGFLFMINATKPALIVGGITVVIIILFILAGVGVFEGWDTPSGARSFAYQHMIEKDNVTISEKFQNGYSSSLWVTDIDGVDYRVQNFWLWYNLQPNHTYQIRYTGGYFNMIWEAE